MDAKIQLIPPDRIKPNPQNPRLIFHQDELDALRESIDKQGILVPLTIYRDGNQFFLLDGERRWRCALKLAHPSVPAIIQPKPDPMTNLMMMFAIHHRRNEWDPLPTALKLQDLERLFETRHGRNPTESELGELASLTRGEVRRLKKLLALPAIYRDELLEELKKPRSKQEITVDHVLESSKAAALLRKKGVLDASSEDQLRRSLLDKFRSKVILNTVAPRKLARLAQAVGRGEVDRSQARKVTQRLITDSQYGIDEAFRDSVEVADFEHSLDQVARRLLEKLIEHERRRYPLSTPVQATLNSLRAILNRLAAK